MRRLHFTFALGPSLKNKCTHTRDTHIFIFGFFNFVFSCVFFTFWTFGAQQAQWIRYGSEGRFNSSTDLEQPPALRVRRGLSKCCGRQWKHGPWKERALQRERERAEKREKINHPVERTLTLREKENAMLGKFSSSNCCCGREKRKEQPVELPDNCCWLGEFFYGFMLSLMLTLKVTVKVKVWVRKMCFLKDR